MDLSEFFGSNAGESHHRMYDTAYYCLACHHKFYDRSDLPTRVGISCPHCGASHYAEGEQAHALADQHELRVYRRKLEQLRG